MSDESASSGQLIQPPMSPSPFSVITPASPSAPSPFPPIRLKLAPLSNGHTVHSPSQDASVPARSATAPPMTASTAAAAASSSVSAATSTFATHASPYAAATSSSSSSSLPSATPTLQPHPSLLAQASSDDLRQVHVSLLHELNDYALLTDDLSRELASSLDHIERLQHEASMAAQAAEEATVQAQVARDEALRTERIAKEAAERAKMRERAGQNEIAHLQAALRHVRAGLPLNQAIEAAASLDESYRISIDDLTTVTSSIAAASSPTPTAASPQSSSSSSSSSSHLNLKVNGERRQQHAQSRRRSRLLHRHPSLEDIGQNTIEEGDEEENEDEEEDADDDEEEEEEDDDVDEDTEDDFGTKAEESKEEDNTASPHIRGSTPLPPTIPSPSAASPPASPSTTHLPAMPSLSPQFCAATSPPPAVSVTGATSASSSSLSSSSSTPVSTSHPIAHLGVLDEWNLDAPVPVSAYLALRDSRDELLAQVRLLQSKLIQQHESWINYVKLIQSRSIIPVAKKDAASNTNLILNSPAQATMAQMAQERIVFVTPNIWKAIKKAQQMKQGGNSVSGTNMSMNGNTTEKSLSTSPNTKPNPQQQRRATDNDALSQTDRQTRHHTANAGLERNRQTQVIRVDPANHTNGRATSMSHPSNSTSPAPSDSVSLPHHPTSTPQPVMSASYPTALSPPFSSVPAAVDAFASPSLSSPPSHPSLDLTPSPSIPSASGDGSDNSVDGTFEAEAPAVRLHTRRARSQVKRSTLPPPMTSGPANSSLSPPQPNRRSTSPYHASSASGDMPSTQANAPTSSTSAPSSSPSQGQLSVYERMVAAKKKAAAAAAPADHASSSPPPA